MAEVAVVVYAKTVAKVVAPVVPAVVMMFKTATAIKAVLVLVQVHVLAHVPVLRLLTAVA
jgi:hypothetical protein